MPINLELNNMVLLCLSLKTTIPSFSVYPLNKPILKYTDRTFCKMSSELENNLSILFFNGYQDMISDYEKLHIF